MDFQLLALLIQSHYACFKENSLSYVRILFTPSGIKRIVENTGWTIVNEQSIHSPQLQDAEWEIAMTVAEYKEEINDLVGLPGKLNSLIQSEVFC